LTKNLKILASPSGGSSGLKYQTKDSLKKKQILKKND